MNREACRQHAGTIQFFFLAFIYTLPLTTGSGFYLVPQEGLQDLLYFETGVVILGFLLTGFLFIPIAMIDHPWAPRICLALAVLMVLPVTLGYQEEFGLPGLLTFVWLLFANFSHVFLSGTNHTERSRNAAEASLRCIVYVVLFALLTGLLDMPTSVSNWRGQEALFFGSAYFAVLTWMEARRYFQRLINIGFHLMSGAYYRPPKSRVRYRNGKIKARVLTPSKAHHWPLLLFVGAACTGISSVTIYATLALESWLEIIAIWLFVGIFLVLGLVFLASVPTLAFKLLKAGPSLLDLLDTELQQGKRLMAEGFIPRYLEKEQRQALRVDLVFYRVSYARDDPDRDIALVEKLVEKRLNDQQLHYAITDSGTRFQLECPLPTVRASGAPPDRVSTARFWSLQVDIDETVRNPGKKPKQYTWCVAFPLPLSA